jgi:DNA-binding transcriptional ArsR family regulator
MIHPDALRSKLVAIASACAGADIPLPIRRDIARITGATLRQVHRHIPALRDRGAITTERRGGRCFVQEARP